MPRALDPEGTEYRALADAVDFRGRRVLEVGVGDGRLAFRYAEGPALVIGVDPSLEDVRAGLAACPPALRDRIRLLPADARALPFRDGVFDIAVLAWSL